MPKNARKSGAILVLALSSAVTAPPSWSVENLPPSGVRMDRGVYPAPEKLPAPKPGETYTDPIFGTTILRVTGPADGKSNHNAYSYWPAFNRDSTRFHISVDGVATLYRFDPQGFKLLGKEPLFPNNSKGSIPRWEDAIWSGVSPDVICAHEGSRIWSYDVAKKEYALVRDLAPEIGPGGVLCQMSKSLNDNAFAFTLKRADGTEAGILVWRRHPDKVLLKLNEQGLDEVQLDKSGRFLLIKTDKQGKGVIQARVADLQSGEITDLIDDAPDFAPGHSDNGNGVVIGEDNWQNRLTFRHLATPHKLYAVLDRGNDWSQGSHSSLLADDEDWILVSFYTGNTLPSTGVFRDEIVQVATDGSQRVRRLAHHRSLYKEYWDTPRASISRDGRFALYTSNWGNPERRDVFILRVPPVAAP